MTFEVLTYVNFIANIFGPLVIIPWLFRKGGWAWPVLVAIFFGYVAMHYHVMTRAGTPQDRLAIALVTASVMMFVGWMMARARSKRDVAQQRKANVAN